MNLAQKLIHGTILLGGIATIAYAFWKDKDKDKDDFVYSPALAPPISNAIRPSNREGSVPLRDGRHDTYLDKIRGAGL